MTQAENNLIISVYLNQRIVFDLFAMHQDGLSEVAQITTIDSSIEKDQKKYGASFGLSRALSALLRIDVSGGRGISKDKSSEIQRSEKRVHTSVSIFYKLRNILKDEKVIFTFDEHYQPKSGDLVEFSADLRKNPIIQTMEMLIGIMDIGISFSDNPNKKGQQRIQTDENKKVKKQMEGFLEVLKTGDTIDVVSDIIINNYKAVITLEREFLNDPTMSDLVDGHFKVLGKIIRVIPDNINSLNLLRKTALSAMPKKILTEALDNLSNLQATGKFDIPSLQFEVQGPVIHLIPVAIFA